MITGEYKHCAIPFALTVHYGSSSKYIDAVSVLLLIPVIVFILVVWVVGVVGRVHALIVLPAV